MLLQIMKSTKRSAIAIGECLSIILHIGISHQRASARARTHTNTFFLFSVQFNLKHSLRIEMIILQRSTIFKLYSKSNSISFCLVISRRQTIVFQSVCHWPDIVKCKMFISISVYARHYQTFQLDNGIFATFINLTIGGEGKKIDSLLCDIRCRFIL